MKWFFQYIWFFFYTAVNWNPLLAFFILYHDIRGYFRYRIRTFMPASLEKLSVSGGDLGKSSHYEAVNYFVLEKLLAAFKNLSETGKIIDLGCGKGRAIVVAAYFGFTNITGIDFAAELCTEAAENMRRTEKRFPGLVWRVLPVNVLDYAIEPDDSVFFLFNPFNEEVLGLFLNRLEESCKQFPRKTWFLYASPLHAGVLTKRGYKTVFTCRALSLEGKILSKD